MKAIIVRCIKEERCPQVCAFVLDVLTVIRIAWITWIRKEMMLSLSFLKRTEGTSIIKYVTFEQFDIVIILLTDVDCR